MKLTTNNILVIGGGFYGAEVALFLSSKGYRVTILEENNDLCQRATYVNQARIHNGYHYPRNYLTALRSHQNYSKFLSEYKYCIDNSFTKVYAIARNNSKVNANQFIRFINKIGSPLKKTTKEIKQLFNEELIEDSFMVEEVAFDAVKLKELIKDKLDGVKVKILYDKSVKSVRTKDGRLVVTTNDGENIQSDVVFNCTYSRINSFLKNSGLPLIPFKHEIIEMALIEEPREIADAGITVMDGPFFSTMPFPAKKTHSLSHVRYTPHYAWTDLEEYKDPYKFLSESKFKSKYQFMIKDAQRYLPILEKAKYKESLYEIKTVLLQNENDDGRPILFRKDYAGIKNLFIVMGGKIDNVYDIIDKLKSIFGE